MRTLISFKKNISLIYTSRVDDVNWEPPVTPPSPPTGPPVQPQDVPHREINIPPAPKSPDTETE